MTFDGNVTYGILLWMLGNGCDVKDSVEVSTPYGLLPGSRRMNARKGLRGGGGRGGGSQTGKRREEGRGRKGEVGKGGGEERIEGEGREEEGRTESWNIGEGGGEWGRERREIGV